MLKKRGLSHIEFVLSFVIFVGFLVFAFVFFNPLSSNRTMKSSLDYAWLEVADETVREMETYSVVIDSAYNGGDVGIKIDGVDVDPLAAVENKDGQIINSYRGSGDEYVYFTSPDSGFVKIRYSDQFDDGPSMSGTQLTLNTDYQISSSQTDKIYFENLLLDLNSSYYSDYTGLKNRFNLPKRIEFGFVLNWANRDITALNSIPEGVEVLSKVDRIMIVNKTGGVGYGDLRVMVW